MAFLLNGVRRCIKIENKKLILFIGILFMLVITLFGWIIGLKWDQSKQESYQQGIQDGYNRAIIQIVQQAITCNQIPLTVGNKTINLIAVGCLGG